VGIVKFSYCCVLVRLQLALIHSYDGYVIIVVSLPIYDHLYVFLKLLAIPSTILLNEMVMFME